MSSDQPGTSGTRRTSPRRKMEMLSSPQRKVEEVARKQELCAYLKLSNSNSKTKGVPVQPLRRSQRIKSLMMKDYYAVVHGCKSNDDEGDDDEGQGKKRRRSRSKSVETRGRKRAKSVQPEIAVAASVQKRTTSMGLNTYRVMQLREPLPPIVPPVIPECSEMLAKLKEDYKNVKSSIVRRSIIDSKQTQPNSTSTRAASTSQAAHTCTSQASTSRASQASTSRASQASTSRASQASTSRASQASTSRASQASTSRASAPACTQVQKDDSEIFVKPRPVAAGTPIIPLKKRTLRKTETESNISTETISMPLLMGRNKSPIEQLAEVASMLLAPLNNLNGYVDLTDNDEQAPGEQLATHTEDDEFEGSLNLASSPKSSPMRKKQGSEISERGRRRPVVVREIDLTSTISPTMISSPAIGVTAMSVPAPHAPNAASPNQRRNCMQRLAQRRRRQSCQLSYPSSTNNEIDIDYSKGPVMACFFEDGFLVIVQTSYVRFWRQSGLGRVLQSQDMWVPLGSILRMDMASDIKQASKESIIYNPLSSLAYVEIWVKEHTFEMRAIPVCDVYAVIYFRFFSAKEPMRKIVQLDKTNGCLQHITAKNDNCIIISWKCCEGPSYTETSYVIRCYHLAKNYENLEVMWELERTEEPITTLYAINECDNILVARSNNFISFWDLRDKFHACTMDLSEVAMPQTQPVCFLCEDGFIFILVLCDNDDMLFIAYNTFNNGIKRLQHFTPPSRLDCFRGALIENGCLVCFYNNGSVCWRLQSGLQIAYKETHGIEYWPSGNSIVSINKGQVNVQHVSSYVVTMDDDL